MGELLGVGMTHFPPLAWPDAAFAAALQFLLADPDLPAALREPAGWPAAMREEWGDDEGAAAAVRHREALVAGCDRIRAAIDDFSPDALVVVGDDQYENFREDVIPAFTVLAYGDRVAVPWDPAQSVRGVTANAWGEPPDTDVPRAREARHRRALVESLLGDELDVAYAYEPLHHAGLPARVHEHRALPRLPPDRVRPPGHPAGDQLLRPARDQPPGDDDAGSGSTRRSTRRRRRPTG